MLTPLPDEHARARQTTAVPVLLSMCYVLVRRFSGTWIASDTITGLNRSPTPPNPIMICYTVYAGTEAKVPLADNDPRVSAQLQDMKQPAEAIIPR